MDRILQDVGRIERELEGVVDFPLQPYIDLGFHRRGAIVLIRIVARK